MRLHLSEAVPRPSFHPCPRPLLPFYPQRPFVTASFPTQRSPPQPRSSPLFPPIQQPTCNDMATANSCNLQRLTQSNPIQSNPIQPNPNYHHQVHVLHESKRRRRRQKKIRLPHTVCTHTHTCSMTLATFPTIRPKPATDRQMCSRP